MKKHYCLLFSLVSIATGWNCVSRANAAETTSFEFSSPLTSVAIEDSIDLERDPDDPGVGGGIDAATYFRTRLVGQIERCTSEIDEAVENWLDSHGLLVVKSERLPGDYFVHAAKDDLAGLFEITYRVSETRERARATVFFYSNDGERHELVGIESMLEDYSIAEFQDALEIALMCENSSD